MKKYKRLEANQIVYFLRATDKQEASQKNPLHYGDYWRFFKSLKQLDNLLKSQQLYVAQNSKDNQYIIIGQGNIEELELNYKQLTDEYNSKEMYFKAKELFDNDYAPSSKILYSGPFKDNLKVKK